MTDRSCGFDKAFDAVISETRVDDAELPQGMQLVFTPQIQDTPLTTHTMLCGWYTISKKKWGYRD